MGGLYLYHPCNSATASQSSVAEDAPGHSDFSKDIVTAMSQAIGFDGVVCEDASIHVLRYDLKQVGYFGLKGKCISFNTFIFRETFLIFEFSQ